MNFFLILIFIFGLAFRLYSLGVPSLWTDEVASIYLSSNFLKDIIFISAKDLHPPFYFLLLHFWIGIFGASAFSSRLLSVIFGLLCIIIIYIICRDYLKSKNLGILSSFFYSSSAFSIIYVDTEARMYSILTFLTLISFYFLLKAIESKREIYWWIYGFIIVLSLYAHYFSFFVFASQLFYLIWLSFKEKIKINFYWTVLFAFYIPWVYIFMKQASSAGDMPAYKVGLSNLFYIFSSFLGIDSLSINHNIAVLFIFLFLFLFGAWKFLSSKDNHQKFILFYFFCSIFLPFFTSTLFTLYILKPVYLCFAMPAFFIIASRAMLEFKNKNIYLFLTIILIFLAVNLSYLYKYHFNPYYWKANWPAAVEFIKNNSKKGDIIFFQLSVNVYPFNYYYLGKDRLKLYLKRRKGKLYSLTDRDYCESGFLKETGLDTFDNYYLSKNVLPHERIWYILSMADYMDPKKETLKWFFKNYKLKKAVTIKQLNHRDINIGEFAKTKIEPQQRQKLLPLSF